MEQQMTIYAVSSKFLPLAMLVNKRISALHTPKPQDLLALYTPNKEMYAFTNLKDAKTMLMSMLPVARDEQNDTDIDKDVLLLASPIIFNFNEPQTANNVRPLNAAEILGYANLRSLPVFAQLHLCDKKLETAKEITNNFLPILFFSQMLVTKPTGAIYLDSLLSYRTVQLNLPTLKHRA